nr:apolipoprotein(a)-like [Lytechinus pictus]
MSMNIHDIRYRKLEDDDENIVSYKHNISSCWYDYKGLNYTGTLSQTLYGRTCQNWSLDFPHDHIYNHVGDHNYCRNPDHAATAWCYTTDVNVTWEYCAVGLFDPECDPSPKGGNISSCWYDYKGLNYTGTLSQTLYGRTCQNWSLDFPHDHSYNHVGDHNYCRNPDHAATAWCYTTDVNVIWEYCAVGLFDPECDPSPKGGNISSCWYDYKGLNYTGTLSQTLYGRTCQNWSLDSPHDHSYNHVGDHNYCRNPDHIATAWCYTTDVNVRWEYCAVGIYHHDCAHFA